MYIYILLVYRGFINIFVNKYVVEIKSIMNVLLMSLWLFMYLYLEVYVIHKEQVWIVLLRWTNVI